MINFPRITWPYEPLFEYDVKLLSDVYRPPGYILLSEVVEMMGKATLGEEWTGEELNARSLNSAILQESNHSEDTLLGLMPDGVEFVTVDVRLHPTRGDWRAITTQGDRLFSYEKEAQALWKQEKPKLLDMLRREIAARQRHNTIARKLQRSLNAAALPSWTHRLNVGDTREIPPDVWGREDIPSVFELGNRLSRWRVPNFIKFMDVDANGLTVSVEGRVVLLQSDVERYIAPAPKPTMPGHPLAGKDGIVEPPESAEAKRRQLDKRPRKPDVEADAILRNRIKSVIAKAKNKWPDLKTRPGVKQMARELVEGQPKRKVESFGQEAIRKILATTYKPMKDRGIPGLSSG